MTTYIIYYTEIGDKKCLICDGLYDLIANLSVLHKSQWVENDSVKILNF